MGHVAETINFPITQSLFHHIVMGLEGSVNLK